MLIRYPFITISTFKFQFYILTQNSYLLIQIALFISVLGEMSEMLVE